jgi:CubicO group peptidase (beta-lactamase class C family)
MGNHTGTSAARKQAVARGLLPIVRVADDPTRWTMAERQSAYGCPGVSVAVMLDGRVDWLDGFGHLTKAEPAPCGPDTIFMVASCSKPVTAMIVLQHVERGLLDLDTDINTYLRRWKVPANDFTAQHPVTLRGILSHTAGLNVNGFGIVPQGAPVASALDLLEGRPPSNQPAVRVDKAHDGTDRYSGGGYLAAQVALEDVTGRAFADLADELLFTPLGMSRTSFHQPLPAHLRHDVASGHGDSGEPWPGGWGISPDVSAGGLFSTARDYAAFLLATRAAYHGENGAVLGRSLAELMCTQHEQGGFGLGFRVIGSGADVRVNHGGSNDGYQSETNLFLASGDGGVVFTNSTSGLFLFREVFNAIATVYDWQHFMPATKRLQRLTEVDLQRYVGSYRIVSGIELPLLRVWAEGGRLWNEIPGLRFGVQEVFCDVDGVLFSQTGPFETRVVFGADGRAEELVATENGAPLLRAVRTDR